MGILDYGRCKTWMDWNLKMPIDGVWLEKPVPYWQILHLWGESMQMVMVDLDTGFVVAILYVDPNLENR